MNTIQEMVAIDRHEVTDDDTGGARPSYGVVEEFPRLREVNYGTVVKSRSHFQFNNLQTCPTGPPDLLHYGIYAGVTSSQFNNDDFNLGNVKSDKDDDGYVGYYHYVNGIKHILFHSIENYIFSCMGITYKNDGYYFTNLDLFQDHKKDVVVTYCSYNIFSQSEFRLKYVFTPISLSRKTIVIDKSFQVIPNDGSRGNTSLNLNKLPDTIWRELNASSVIRLFVQLDDPSKQLPGLISLNDHVLTLESIKEAISLLVEFLPTGFLTDSDSHFGVVTSCANGPNRQLVKTNVYRNRLVDTICRLCELDYTGGLITYAINEVKSVQNGDLLGVWSYIILKLLKLPNGTNNSGKFVDLIYLFYRHNGIFTTQSCLILIEQVKFLISKNDYDKALNIAKITIQILPLDFDSWYYLALCYALLQDYESALTTINSFPMSLNDNNTNLVSGVPDEFSRTFLNNYTHNQEPISEKTFLKYFPAPKTFVSTSFNHSIATDKTEGKIKSIWDDLFIFNGNARHPIMGNQFYQSPLVCRSAKEVSLVDSNLVKLVGISSAKIKLSGYSSNNSSSSLLDFSSRSPWGRSYDLLSFMVAKIGWDEMVEIKQAIFKNHHVPAVEVNSDQKRRRCEGWLDQLFFTIVQDLRSLTNINSPERQQNHSVLEWEILGLLGWNVKYNLKGSISSLITSAMNNNKFEINYFGSVQLLKIYDEFILSDLNDSQIDIYNDDYSKSSYTNKLILKPNQKLFNTFTNNMFNEYLTLDFILLIIIKLISWNLRWYQYVPDYLINKVLMKLILLHSPEFIVSKFKIIFEQNKKKTTQTFGLFGWKTKSDDSANKFDADDTIIDHIEQIVNWLESIKS